MTLAQAFRSPTWLELQIANRVITPPPPPMMMMPRTRRHEHDPRHRLLLLICHLSLTFPSLRSQAISAHSGDTGLHSKAVPRLRECCRQVEADVVSSSRNKTLATWERPYSYNGSLGELPEILKIHGLSSYHLLSPFPHQPLLPSLHD